MILWEYHIFSQDDISLYFHKLYLRSFKAEKGVKFLPHTKIFPPSATSSQLALPQLVLSPTGTSLN